MPRETTIGRDALIGPLLSRLRLGPAVPFSLEPADDPIFDRRLLLAGHPGGCWIRLAYRTDATARPLRPMIRFVRAGGAEQDFVLPGVALDAACWLGLLPKDLTEIRLAAGPDFLLERVALASHARLLAECLVARPSRFVPALYNRLRGDERRYRDILRGACAVTPLTGYANWKSARARPPHGRRTASDLTIRLILPARAADGSAVARTVESLRTGSHRAWTLVVTGAERQREAQAAASDARVTQADWDETVPATALLGDADALGFLCPDDRLRPDALSILADRLAGSDVPDLVYADAEIGGTVPVPRLKPDWSPDLALVTAYPGRPTLLARRLIERLGDRPAGPANGRALCLAAMAAARTAAHVPRILLTAQIAPEDSGEAAELDRHLEAAGSPARAGIADGILDLRWPLPDPAPLVSIVIPSRDRPDLIGRITQDVLHRTDYPALDLVIVDNGSTDPAVLRLYERLRADGRARIAPYPHPFNFSAMVNIGARAARGKILVLLNNDIAVQEPGWLAALVAQALRPDVGAVGAKLLYGDGSLQHAGVVVGLGGRAGHILRRRPGDAPGHLGRMRVAHEVSAVTAACLAIERAKYEAVGGFDEETFAVDFNDVDFCLRLGAAGWKTMWTPRAVLAHLESVSRGPSTGAARARFEREGEAFVRRWRDVIRHDPFYHPALSLTTFGEDLE